MAYNGRFNKGAFTPEMLQKKLPMVGDYVKKRMCTGTHYNKLRSCRVTYVNHEHLWYEVEFPCGVRQAYKLI